MAGANQGGIYSVLDDERINGRADFFAGLGAGIDGSWAMQLGTYVPSSSEIELYKWLGTAPQMSVWEGEAVFDELPNYGAALRNIEYARGLRVQKADLRRDKTGQIRTRIGQLGNRVGTHWESIVSTLISGAETAVAGTLDGATNIAGQSFDVQAFFDTDHSYTGSAYTTSQSNDLSSGVYDVTTATAPTPTEAAAIVQDMVGNFWSLKDDQAEPINGDARSFTIMVGTVALWAPINQALSLANLASGASNPVEGLRAQGITINAVLNPRLSAKTTKVYMFRTDGAGIRSFILQEEVAPMVSEEDPGAKFKYIEVLAQATRAAGFGLWQNACLATLS